MSAARVTFTERDKQFDVEKLLASMRSARTLNDLVLYGEQAKTAPPIHIPALRLAYVQRREELRGEK